MIAVAVILAGWVGVSLLASWVFGKLADATLADGPAE